MDYFKVKSGAQLKLHQWTVDQAKADIIFVHGFGEHSGRYDYEAQFFNNGNYNFLSYDQRFHGQSDGKPLAYVKDFSVLTDDYLQILDHYRKNSERPFYLFSHSMGGLVLTHSLLKSNFSDPHLKGVLFSAPFLMPDKNTAPLLQKLAGIVALILPGLKTVKIDPSAISRDDKEVQKYINDPLIYGEGVRAKTGHVMIQSTKAIIPQFANFNYPFIIQHGTDDKLAELEGSRLLHQNSPSSDKELVVLEDYRHEITRELNRDQILKTYLDWMDSRLA